MSYPKKGILFGYGVQSTNRTTEAAATAGLRHRREGSIPKFTQGMVAVEAPHFQGRWGASDNESVAGYSLPVFSFPGYLRPGLMDLLLAQVMSEAAPDGNGNIAFSLLSGTDCNPASDTYLTLWRRNSLLSSEDEKLIGAVMKSFKVSSSWTQQRVNIDVEFLAYSFTDGVDGSGGCA